MDNKSVKKTFNNNYIYVIFMYIVSFIFLLSIPSIEDVESRLIPYIISISAIVLTTILFLKTYFNKGKKEDDIDLSGSSSAILMAVILLIYIGAIAMVGFYISTPFYLYISMWVLGQKNKKLILAVSLLTPLTVYLFFDLLLKLPIPQGVLFS